MKNILKLLKFLPIVLVLNISAGNAIAETTAKKSKKDIDFLLVQKPLAAPKSEVGVASYYGDDFQGKRTANGGIFDKNEYTAAHLKLPLPSVVRVTNLSNKRSVIVVVNDRGPYVDDRVIDLSEKAAHDLGMIHKGISKVRIDYLPYETKKLLARLPAKNGPKAKLAFHKTIKSFAAAQNKKVAIKVNEKKNG